MNPEQWQKIKSVFYDARGRTPIEREIFLDKACGGDEEMRREVESLLSSSEASGSFMQNPAIGEIAETIAGNKEKLLVNQTLSHYKILKLLGEGGMGEVYLAEDTRLERLVALKILPAAFAQDAERMRRFVREAKAASALNHPNILTIYETGETDNTNYIASEYVEGETLTERLRREPLNLKAALDVAAQIASALQAAHCAKIVHRDIKPDNVMIRPDGFVKLLDFGIAKLTERKTELIDAEAATAIKSGTSPGMIIGTANYMSPEQARGKAVDARSDIFSFGLVLYEMLSGKRAFEGENAMDVISSILQKEPVPLSRVMPDVPHEIERIVGKALRKDCEERYQTAKDLLNDLKDARQELEFQSKLERTDSPNRNEAKTQVFNAATNNVTHTTSSAPYVTSKIKQHKRGAGISLLVILLASVGFGYWYFSYRSISNTKQIESIAVIPFVNESGNADVEYLSDGMTETLISRLSQLPNLNVKARSSVFRYKGKEMDGQTIGKELNVQAILTGRIIQRKQDLTVYIELIDAMTENVLWKQDYNRQMANLINLQNEIVLDVSNKLKIRFSSSDEQKKAKNSTKNSEAYLLYLRGLYHWYRFPGKEFEKSRDYFQQAINVDPSYALAYAGLADYYGFSAANGILPPDENWVKAEAAANKALELDESLGEAHNSLAAVRLYYYHDWVGSENEFKKGIQLSPNFAEIHNHYALNLIDFGQSEEAIAEIKKALELEPLSVRYNRNLADFFCWMRNYDIAVEHYQKTLELDPNDAFTHQRLGDVYEHKGMRKEAITEWSRSLSLTGDNESAMMLERNFSALGFDNAIRTLYQKKLEQLNERSKRGEYIPAMNYALAYTQLTNKEQAFSWLLKAEQEHNRLIFDIKLDPTYDILRDDPRFQELLRRVGLPQ